MKKNNPWQLVLEGKIHPTVSYQPYIPLVELVINEMRKPDSELNKAFKNFYLWIYETSLILTELGSYKQLQEESYQYSNSVFDIKWLDGIVGDLIRQDPINNEEA